MAAANNRKDGKRRITLPPIQKLASGKAGEGAIISDYAAKNKWGGTWRVPPRLNSIGYRIKLELPLRTEPEVERCTERSRFAEVHVEHTSLALEVLINQPNWPAVEDVEEVSDEADSLAFVQLPRIVHVKIKLSEERGATQRTTTPDRNLAGVQIRRMCAELAERHA